MSFTRFWFPKTVRAARSEGSKSIRQITASAVALAALFLLPGVASAADTCSAAAHTCTLQPHPLHPGGKPSVIKSQTSTPQAALPVSLPARYAKAAKTILKMGNGQAKIIRAFTTPAGLYGFSVQIGTIATHDVIIYVTPNGRYFLVGGMFDAKGKNLSAHYARKYLPAAELAPKVQANNPDSYAASLAKTTWFTIGKTTAPKHLWFLFDPNCIFCHLTWEKLLPDIQDGHLLIRVVPVGFLKPSSAGKAAAILMAKDPAAAMAANEAGFNDATEEGGITVPKHIPARIAAEVSANTAWMQKNGVGGTPFLLWKGPHGKIHDQDGMPTDIPSFLKGVGH
ncbi:thiol:disulfide interchange protein DsbG [Acidithiobacillus sp. MC6.1]|nr:thiol:disulfide interchange protein DsbG [Acidithiobacillus sp. MC6.1]